MPRVGPDFVGAFGDSWWMSFRMEGFDPDRFERAMRDQMNAGLSRYAASMQAALDGVHGEAAGRPVEEVKPILQRAWLAVTGDTELTDPHLTAFAEAISEGRRVRLDTSEFRI